MILTRLICLEPEDPGSRWQPFTGARPLAELRAGAWLIRERWADSLGLEQVAIMGEHVAGFRDVDSAPVLARGPVPGPAIVARSDFAPAGPLVSLSAGVRRLTHEGETVAWVVPEGDTWNGGDAAGEAFPIDGVRLRGAWDLITALEQLLAGDCADALANAPDPVPDGCLVLGDPGDVACFGAWVEPGVVFDVRQGAVVLQEGVQVRSGTRLEGPLFVGPGSFLLGGAIRNSAIGPQCRVHGEVAASVFTGYANKSHDGFLGHSVVGQWCNLGAGTITSNLKNTYGEVRLDLPGGRLQTGRSNLGTLFGDHVKTAIGTLMSTGSVIGCGASLLGPRVPRWVPPFSWGVAAPAERAQSAEFLDVDGFVKIARRVMPRRQVQVGVEEEASLRALHGRLTR